ncbi:MAG TPA: efflux RND transporter periplasmic adaptor subunit [Terriglobales bacterium]|nr:efflux RND transporter periplasmic adaptor subunit [Terriglobales bacterium]
MGSQLSTPDLSSLKIDHSARHQGGPKWLRYVFAAIGLLLLVSALVFALKGKAPEVMVTTVHATTADTRVALLNASGYVTPRRRATVAAKVTGRVIQMIADEGMHVQEGQVLAYLDDSDARVRLNSARSDREATAAALADLKVNLENADRELRRTDSLHQGGVASQQALDLAKTTADSLRARIALTEEQVRAADSRIKVAQQDLDNCTVRSPFTGIVVSKDAQVGEMVSPISAGGGFTRTGIATVVDMRSLEVEVDVNESYIARVKPGQPVTAILDAYPDWKIPCTVRTVIPTADRQKATVKVRISFNQLDPRILPDMGVKVSFLGDEPAPASGTARLLIPKDAIRNENGQQVVFLYKDGRVERRAVRVGGTSGDSQEVLAGINDGDQLVTSGFDGLHDGQQVGIKKQ